MGLFDFLNRSDSKPRLGSKKDAIKLLTNLGADDRLAWVLADALEHVGRDGYIEIKPGGNGQPYFLERIQPPVTETLNETAVLQVKQLQRILNAAVSESEQEWNRSKIAELTGVRAIVWICASDAEDFEMRRKKIREILSRFIFLAQ